MFVVNAVAGALLPDAVVAVAIEIAVLNGMPMLNSTLAAPEGGMPMEKITLDPTVVPLVVEL